MGLTFGDGDPVLFAVVEQVCARRAFEEHTQSSRRAGNISLSRINDVSQAAFRFQRRPYHAAGDNCGVASRRINIARRQTGVGVAVEGGVQCCPVVRTKR